MSLNEEHFNKAFAQLEQRRSKNNITQKLRHDEVCDRIPEYAQLEKLLGETSHKLIALMLNSDDNKAEQLKQLEENNLSIQKNMEQLLVTGGFPSDYLKPVYTCPICKDKGTIDGRWCECFNRLMLSAAAQELNNVSPLSLSSFDNFRLDVYSEQNDPELGTSPRTIMQHNLNFCKKYSESFTTESDGILMNGGTGLGKTHLSLAIANRVLNKGYSVIYGSVPELLRTIEREYFGKSDADTMDTLTKCDLLILDDLGAEMDKPLYTSLLYELINARISRGLPMIISTNLGANDMKQRYQDRIWSRLFSLEVLVFAGGDVRRKLKKK